MTTKWSEIKRRKGVKPRIFEPAEPADLTPPPATPLPGGSLDEAWRRVEAALPEGVRLALEHTPRGLDVARGGYRAWAIGLDTAWGSTPALALIALAEHLEALR